MVEDAIPDLRDDFGPGTDPGDEEIDTESIGSTPPAPGPLDDDDLPPGMSEEDIRRYEEGITNDPGEPDIKRIDNETRVEMEALEDGSKVPVGAGVSEAQRRLEGPLTQSIDIHPIAESLADLGTQVRIKVTRLSPPGFPVEEAGQSDWIPVPGTEPSKDQIEQIIRERWGGGTFEVLIASTDPMRVNDFARNVIELGGDPTPFTLIGRMHMQKVYGFAPIPEIQTREGGSSVAGAGGGGTSGVAMAEMVMGMIERREQRERDRERETKVGETGLAAAVVSALAPQRSQGTGLVELLAVLAPIGERLIAASAEDRRAREDREERRHQQTMAMMQERQNPQQPQEVVQAMQAVIGIVQARAESEMKMGFAQQQTLFDHMLKQMREHGQEEEAGILSSLAYAIRERGGDMLANLGPILQNMMSGQSAAEQLQAAQQQVDPRLIAANSGYPPGAGPAPQLPAAPQAVAAQPVSSPPQVPAQPPEAGVVPPQAEPGDQLPPEEVQQVPQDGQPPPAESYAVAMTITAMKQFVYYTSVFCLSQPEPDAAWEASLGENTMEVLFGLSPKVFRDRVIAPFTSAANWVEGANDPEVFTHAEAIDKAVATDPAAQKWLEDWLSIGPWTDEDEDDE